MNNLSISTAIIPTSTLPDLKISFWNKDVRKYAETYIEKIKLITELDDATKKDIIEGILHIRPITRYADLLKDDIKWDENMIARDLRKVDLTIESLSREDYQQLIISKIERLNIENDKLKNNDIKQLDILRQELIGEQERLHDEEYKIFASSEHDKIYENTLEKYEDENYELNRQYKMYEKIIEEAKKETNFNGHTQIRINNAYSKIRELDIRISELAPILQSKRRLYRQKIQFSDNNLKPLFEKHNVSKSIRRYIEELKTINLINTKYHKEKIKDNENDLKLLDKVKGYQKEHNIYRHKLKILLDPSLHTFIELCDKFKVPKKYFSGYYIEDGLNLYLISSKLNSYLSNYISIHHGEKDVDKLTPYVYFFEYIFNDIDLNDNRPFDKKMSDYINSIRLNQEEILAQLRVRK